MDRRIELQRMLEQLLGSRSVYFQPPSDVKMKYPAIVYHLNNIGNTHANNKVYIQSNSYSVTVIDSNPDSDIVDKVSQLPMCTFNRHYTADGMNHNVFTLYY